MELFLKADTWLALLTLCFLEIVLGIDNIIFISIVSNKLPEESRTKARNLGLFLAMFVRISLLLTITWIIQFTAPLFTVPANFIFGEPKNFSGKDLILGFGGLFLIAKSTMEINHGMENDEEDGHRKRRKKKTEVTFFGTIVQIILLDIIFSFDSILTAVGIVDPDKVLVMIIAVIVSIFVMMFFSGHISRFIQQHPSMEVLALGFLILIGFMLFLEALEFKVPKGYIYFAVAFALLIELTNIRVKKSRKPNPKKLNKKSYNDPSAQAPSHTEYDPLKYPIGKYASQENYSLQDIEAAIKRIKALPAALGHAIKDLSDDQLDTAYRDGGWSVRQVVHHVADSHTNAYIRTKWTLTEDEPTIKAYDEKAWAKTPETKLSPSYSIELLKDLHSKWTELLSQLSPEELEKSFLHPETGNNVRLNGMIALYAWHGEHHLAQIVALKERKGW